MNLKSSLLSSTYIKPSESQKRSPNVLSTTTGSIINGVRIPPGHYRLDEPLNLSDPMWFHRLMYCKE